MNYVSLFSSAGIGDYGFFQAGFKLIASNELLSKRMDIQLANHIAAKDSAYILGDITTEKVREAVLNEVKQYYINSNDTLDILVATPPCQGISVANHYKKSSDLKRNSLVLESILIAEKLNPKIIVFENVKRFLKTACTDIDNKTYSINEIINKHLSEDYCIYGKELNFKDYGANSSRPRTLVIATRKDMQIRPELLMPSKITSKTLRQVIGDLPSLTQMGEIDSTDILHSFRKYRPDMRDWIHSVKPGESAFNNTDPLKRPHRVIHGKIIPNVNKNSNKYTRQQWDKVAPAIHTRNDILASQNTIHPEDDRVFSIRELMRMMNVPATFKWSLESYDYLNDLNQSQKAAWLKKHAITIRQSIGEAVPTVIFRKIGEKAYRYLKEKSNENNQNKGDYKK